MRVIHVSILSLTSISLNRYLHVCHHHLYSRIFSLPGILVWKQQGSDQHDNTMQHFHDRLQKERARERAFVRSLLVVFLLMMRQVRWFWCGFRYRYTVVWRVI
nr:hypothetical protein BaRGS_001941 [Batillaria attramentaria]